MAQPARKAPALAVVLLLVGLAAGFGGGYLITQPTINDLTARANGLQADLTTARQENTQLQAEVTSVRADLNSAQASLSATQQQLTTVQTSLQTTQADLRAAETELTNLKVESEGIRTRLAEIDEAVQRLEADRLVLIELRRDRSLSEFPDPADPAAVATAREELRAYWERVRGLAVTADSSLTPALDQILARIDPWLDWVQQFPINGTLEDLGRWYAEGGIGGFFGYFDAVDDFESQLNLIVITHVDRAAGLIE